MHENVGGAVGLADEAEPTLFVPALDGADALGLGEPGGGERFWNLNYNTDSKLQRNSKICLQNGRN